MNQIVQSTESPVSPVEQLPGESREQAVLRVAESYYHKSSDWTAFFREVLGAEGIVRKTFSAGDDLEAFEHSREYSQIQQMLAKLRERKETQGDDAEPTRVITVRLPKSLHESLRKEAYSRQTSMNKLCISKLLQIIDDGLVPPD